MHLVTRAHFRSRDKDDRRTIRTAIVQPQRQLRTLGYFLPEAISTASTAHDKLFSSCAANSVFSFSVVRCPLIAVTLAYRHLNQFCDKRTNERIVENPMTHANLMSLSFIETELLPRPREVLHCGNMDFLLICSRDLDLDRMTFIYQLDTYFLEM